MLTSKFEKIYEIVYCVILTNLFKTNIKDNI